MAEQHAGGSGRRRVRSGSAPTSTASWSRTPGPAAGVGGALLPGLLRAGRGPDGRARGHRGQRALTEPRRRGGVRREGRRGSTAGGAAQRYDDSPIEALRGHVRLQWDAILVVRGGRAGVRPPPQPVHADRHPRQLAARADRGGRGDRGRLDPAPRPVRDRAAAALLPADDRRAARPAAAVGDAESHCPYKGTASYYSVEIDGHGDARTSSGTTRRRCPRARRSRAWPASTTRRSTSTSTASCSPGRRRSSPERFVVGRSRERQG